MALLSLQPAFGRLLRSEDRHQYFRGASGEAQPRLGRSLIDFSDNCEGYLLWDTGITDLLARAHRG